MANARRGEVDFTIAGKPVTLCLTLGALAEIEHAFGAADLVALGERLASGRLAAKDLIAILGAAARGGGAALSDAEVGCGLSASELPRAAAAVAKLFGALFPESSPNP